VKPWGILWVVRNLFFSSFLESWGSGSSALVDSSDDSVTGRGRLFLSSHLRSPIPLTNSRLRRIDCVLAPTKPNALQTHARLKGKLDNLDPQLRRASGYAFYNTSPYDFDRLLADAPNLADNLRAYISSFSANMREVLEKFDSQNTLSKLDEAGQSLLKAAMQQMHLSARAYHRALKLARTIANLVGSQEIQTAHIAEAIQYRPRRMV